jgi:hypothetical protein
MKIDKPKFKHDCSNCVFIGRMEGHDIYRCRKSVIARYGDEGWEYLSSDVRCLRDINFDCLLVRALKMIER